MTLFQRKILIFVNSSISETQYSLQLQLLQILREERRTCLAAAAAVIKAPDQRGGAPITATMI